jgi:hypothetical protein
MALERSVKRSQEDMPPKGGLVVIPSALSDAFDGLEKITTQRS